LYFPYFRGKQYELITIRETADVIAESEFIPIIEPVKSQLSGLRRSLDSLCEVGASAIVIINPLIGDFERDGTPISEFLVENFADRDNILFGLMLSENISTEVVVATLNHYEDKSFALIHNGFTDASTLSNTLETECQNVEYHVFMHEGSRLYRRHFSTFDGKVLIVNGFEQRRNKDHPDIEMFSDLHITYPDMSMTGFGDFLIAGDEYREGGGPAYTVAIHITYVDSAGESEMFIHHFKSISQDTPQNPAGKFAEALQKLMDALHAEDNQIIETSAITEFRDLHNRGHYPGLGYVKKLSMIHHIEVLAGFLGDD